MEVYKVNTEDMWLEENNYAVTDKSSADNYFPPTTELEFMKVFCEFPYPSEAQLKEFSEKFGLSYKFIERWFNMKRLQNQISWSPSGIEHAKSIIAASKYQQKQNNGEGLRNVASHDDKNISEMPSGGTVGSTSQDTDVKIASSSEIFVNILVC